MKFTGRIEYRGGGDAEVYGSAEYDCLTVDRDELEVIFLQMSDGVCRFEDVTLDPLNVAWVLVDMSRSGV